MLSGKKIVLGVTGGIAAYKVAELTRELVKSGAQLKVVMTRNALEFITPLTMQTLARGPVHVDMFNPASDLQIDHISLADEAEAVIVAPATANLLGKVAAGIADDLLATTIMATRAPVIFAPAMNNKMWENGIVQANITRLTSLGYKFVEPEVGELACGTEGQGRLAALPDIIEEIELALSPQDLAGRNILVTAGPTREPLDPVRFISNHSSGKMGYALARVARRRGAAVTLISGPTALAPPRGVQYVQVTTAAEMRREVRNHFNEATVVIKAAAVADYRPGNYCDRKIKKGDSPLNLPLERNPDILAELGELKGSQLLVGFALETGDPIPSAREKLSRKNLDLIVANDIEEEGAGFSGDTNVVTLLYRDGAMEKLPRLDKLVVAGEILNRIKSLLGGKISA